MDASKLSSNWKKLQATIKAQPSQKKLVSQAEAYQDEQRRSLKRKSPADPVYNESKKRKAESGTTTGQPRSSKLSRAKMGGSLSTAAPPVQNGQSNGRPSPRSRAHSKSTTTTSPDETAFAAPNGYQDQDTTTAPSSDPTALAGKYIGLDCEMVGTHSITPLSVPAHNQSPTGPAEYSILARVSIVNYAMQPLYDVYVLPPPGVTISDYRTRWSGITPWHLNPDNAATAPKPFEVAQAEVAALLKDRVLVGHALKNDLEVLGLSHPRRDIRDTSRHAPFRALSSATPGGKGRTPGLKKLAQEVLGWKIQGDDKKGHSSVEDAGAAMALFKKDKVEFEREHAKVWGRDSRRNGVPERVGKEVVVGNGKVVEVVTAKGKVTDDEAEEGDEEAEEDEDDLGDDENGSDDEATPKKVPTTTQKKKKKKKKKSRTKRA